MNFNDAILILKENDIKIDKKIIFPKYEDICQNDISGAIVYLCEEYDWGCELIKEVI